MVLVPGRRREIGKRENGKREVGRRQMGKRRRKRRSPPPPPPFPVAVHHIHPLFPGLAPGTGGSTHDLAISPHQINLPENAVGESQVVFLDVRSFLQIFVPVVGAVRVMPPGDCRDL